ncbi:DUF799 domain-containing protein [Campylobacter geochelonis]|uniref:DUF799 domain-containing protein n=1 Tax=Campylobacter geochelonis TaxID=1780362 RepID=UPI00077083F6|nr:GNA1162 family protein [Campylobacter geochelonis]CZE50518.1 lipoprotein [Campylobacter geochelonis]
MANRVKFLLLALVALLFSGCVNEPKPYDYSPLLSAKPRSILVLMPTNESLEPKGSSAVLANATLPLSEAGYYVFPVALVNDTFKFNGVSEASEIHQIPLHKLKEIFNSDAVLYINVKTYGTNYAIISSATTVALEAKLVEANSGTLLWEHSAVATNQGQNNGNIFAMMIVAAIQQIADSVSDAGFGISAWADNLLFMPDCNGCLLRGEYSPNFRQDRQLAK